jgi:hypothetical protein
LAKTTNYEALNYAASYYFGPHLCVFSAVEFSNFEECVSYFYFKLRHGCLLTYKTVKLKAAGDF